MRWPQIVIASLYLIYVAYSISHHGEEYKQDWNGWRAILITFAMFVILHCGGFW